MASVTTNDNETNTVKSTNKAWLDGDSDKPSIPASKDALDIWLESKPTVSGGNAKFVEDLHEYSNLPTMVVWSKTIE